MVTGCASRTSRPGDGLRYFPSYVPVKFAMRAHVPPDHPTAPTKLSWMAVMPDGNVAIAEIAHDGVPIEVVG